MVPAGEPAAGSCHISFGCRHRLFYGVLGWRADLVPRAAPSAGTKWFEVVWWAHEGVFLAFGNDVSQNGWRLARSADGTSWTEHVGSTPGVIWRGFCCSEELGVLVATGDAGHLMWSFDGGATWTGTVKSSSHRTAVVWAPQLGLFAATGSPNADGTSGVLTSDNGMSWLQRPLPSVVVGFSRPELGRFAALATDGAGNCLLVESESTCPFGTEWDSVTMACQPSPSPNATLWQEQCAAQHCLPGELHEDGSCQVCCSSL